MGLRLVSFQRQGKADPEGYYPTAIGHGSRESREFPWLKWSMHCHVPAWTGRETRNFLSDTDIFIWGVCDELKQTFQFKKEFHVYFQTQTKVKVTF